LSETLSRDTIEKPRLIPKPLIWLNYLCIYISSLTLYLLSNANFLNPFIAYLPCFAFMQRPLKIY
ncbi:hypothetical protein, partial [Candidatus Bandiella numerosa]|uniref:hypothetical protein n=1 Tax=Candidatus Bandiella numerosa TaxID=2570586 RepID=UPI001F3FF335